MNQNSRSEAQWTGRGLVEFGIRHSGAVIVATLVAAVVFGALMLRVTTDTDPENMLPSDHPVRLLNQSLRDDFGAGDVLAVGIVDDSGVLDPGIFTAASALVVEIQNLEGVVPGSVVSFVSAVDVGTGPLSAEDVGEIVAAVDANPLLAGRVIARNGTALGIFVTLESKGVAAEVASDIKGLAADEAALANSDIYTAGLPLAQDQFGLDMFVQMAILAPLAGLLIFVLMLWFFRSFALVGAAMAVAMLTVISTMGLLIGTGFSLHIMSSMIPVFLMPIAILDSIHVLSEFFDKYPQYRDRRTALLSVYQELFVPLTYTSITTAVAFASLMLVPIPPVRVFGGFVAAGVLAAWLLTVLFLPALVMRFDETRLMRLADRGVEHRGGTLKAAMTQIGSLVARKPRMVLVAFGVVTIAAIPGVAAITVNDNPVRWFRSGTEIRQATEQLNERFEGVYNASFVLTAEDPELLTQAATVVAITGLQRVWADLPVVGSSASYIDVGTTSEGLTPTGTELSAVLDTVLEGPQGPFVERLITPDQTRANIQLLLRNGDNEAMQSVVDATSEQLSQRPLPDGVTATWAGESYLNLVWQDEMVSGMLVAFVGTLFVVLLLMIALFRSLRWALLAIVPVLASVLVVYGAAGWLGKDYDMPMAVLSTLVLGIGVDFAIHFVQRYRELLTETGSAQAALDRFYQEPARALTRNALVITLGFLPMFASSLAPYLVVATFLAAIMTLSWLTTLFVLPSMVLMGSAGGLTKGSSEIRPDARRQKLLV
ncbi:MAG: RND family transporter [Acidimicrobiales bacterium]